MLNFKKQCIGGLLALSIGGMALAANADTATQSGRHAPPTPEMMAKFSTKMAKRQEALHAKLKLTAAQEPAWNTYVEQSKPPQRGEGMQRPDREAMSKLSTPERMAQHLAGMQAREAFMTTRLNTVKTFYAVLTPAQQKIFDAESMRGFGHHWHHRDHDGKRDDAK
jgi:protein CpxP